MAGPIFWGHLSLPWATACVRLPAGHSLCSAEAAVTVAQEACQWSLGGMLAFPIFKPC